MFNKSDLFLFALTILQVAARYKNVEPDHIDNEINPGPAEVSSSSLRIVSGWEAQPGQHPHHAALRMVNTNGGMRVCGGSIVSKEWVLSSAYCTISRVLAVVRVGVVDINDSNPENIFETSEWYDHPQFNNLSTALQSHGVTLLKLQRPVVYTRLVKRIQIQSSADAYRNYDGEQVYTSGHGRTSTSGPDSDVLRWVYLRVISNSECRMFTTVFDTTICARYFNVTSQSTCFNDNGGPLVHVGFDGVPTLIGVTFSFPASSLGCDVGRAVDFYRPGAFLPWFKEVTGIDFENLQDDEDETPTTSTASSTTTTTTTTPIPLTTPTTTTTPSSTSTPTTTTTFSTTTDSNDLGPEDFTPEDNITATPEDSEEKEEEEDSESNEDNDVAQIMKRFEVNVKVKVAFNKYNVTKEMGADTSVSKH